MTLGFAWAGATFVYHDDVFPQRTPDAVWLLWVARKGWVAVTRDRQIQYNPLERRVIMNAGVRCVVLVGKDMTGVDMARALMNALPHTDALALNEQPPFIAKVTRAGTISSIVR